MSYLYVIDLDETCGEPPGSPIPDGTPDSALIWVSSECGYFVPYQHVRECVEKWNELGYKIAVWSRGLPRYVYSIVSALFPKVPLLFVWTIEECSLVDNNYIKDLATVVQMYPQFTGHVCLIDDEKVQCDYNTTHGFECIQAPHPPFRYRYTDYMFWHDLAANAIEKMSNTQENRRKYPIQKT